MSSAPKFVPFDRDCIIRLYGASCWAPVDKILRQLVYQLQDFKITVHLGEFARELHLDVRLLEQRLRQLAGQIARQAIITGVVFVYLRPKTDDDDDASIQWPWSSVPVVLPMDDERLSISVRQPLGGPNQYVVRHARASRHHLMNEILIHEFDQPPDYRARFRSRLHAALPEIERFRHYITTYDRAVVNRADHTVFLDQSKNDSDKRREPVRFVEPSATLNDNDVDTMIECRRREELFSPASLDQLEAIGRSLKTVSSGRPGGHQSVVAADVAQYRTHTSVDVVRTVLSANEPNQHLQNVEQFSRYLASVFGVPGLWNRSMPQESTDRSDSSQWKQTQAFRLQALTASMSADEQWTLPLAAFLTRIVQRMINDTPSLVSARNKHHKHVLEVCIAKHTQKLTGHRVLDSQSTYLDAWKRVYSKDKIKHVMDTIQREIGQNNESFVRMGRQPSIAVLNDLRDQNILSESEFRDLISQRVNLDLTRRHPCDDNDQ